MSTFKILARYILPNKTCVVVFCVSHLSKKVIFSMRMGITLLMPVTQPGTILVLKYSAPGRSVSCADSSFCCAVR
jgi:hypothetical protein